MTTASRLFSDHLSSSQFLLLFSTALKVVPSLPPSAQVFSPLPCSSQLSLTTLTSAHLVFTLLNSSKPVSTLLQLFPPLLTSASAQLISPLSQPISTLLTYSTLASSSQLFSPPVTKMLTQRASCDRRSICTQQALTHGKLLHAANFYAKQAFAQRSFYTKQAFAQRSFYTKKLLHREAVTHSKLLHREAFTHSKLLHRENFTESRHVHREPITRDAFTTFYTQQALHKVRPSSTLLIMLKRVVKGILKGKSSMPK